MLATSGTRVGNKWDVVGNKRDKCSVSPRDCNMQVWCLVSQCLVSLFHTPSPQACCAMEVQARPEEGASHVRHLRRKPGSGWCCTKSVEVNRPLVWDPVYNHSTYTESLEGSSAMQKLVEPLVC
eukprot:1406556-Amphidinium_carterae.1